MALAVAATRRPSPRVGAALGAWPAPAVCRKVVLGPEVGEGHRAGRGASLHRWALASSGPLAAALLRRRRRRRTRAATASAAVAGVVAADSDVVLVYDPKSKQAGETAMAVERDCAMAHKPVAYRAVPSSDTSAIVELAAKRGLSEEAVGRLQRPSSAAAVLPSGALLEDLEMDPGPLMRELRYRTCLEAPTEAEAEHLERAFFQPLRTLRERWWWNPMAMNVLARQLSEQSFAFIDNFLPEEQVLRLRQCNERLYQTSTMQKGSTTGGQSRVGLPHRGDHVKWVGYGGASDEERAAAELTASIEEALQAMGQCAERDSPEVAQALKGLRWRSEAMLTCYPAETRARYFRHTDNSSNNGRLLTAILYLNDGWQPEHGGQLRLFHAGEQNLKIKTEVQPLWNRLLLFWSDERCPHEVLSACNDRYAATVWYYDGQNPNIPLFELGASTPTTGSTPAPAPAPAATQPPPPAGAAPPPPAAGAVPPPPVGAAPPPPAGAVPPPPVAAAAPPTGAVAPPAPVGAVAPPAPAGAAPAPAADEPVVFYDGSDWQAAQLATSSGARCVDLRAAGAAEALRGASDPSWAELLEQGVDKLCEEAGTLFLRKPCGSLLLHGEREQWMLKYELEYAQVQPAPQATQDRLRKTMLEPLEKARAAGGSPEQPWWAKPAAIEVWGPALEKESFIVLDDFLPQQAAYGLAAAVQRMKSEMAPGRTDSKLSAQGRGDNIIWANAGQLPELGPLVESLNALVGGMMNLPQPALQARLEHVSALSDAQLAVYPGDAASDDARYIRHVDNEDGKNGRLLTCTFYLNDGWDARQHGGEFRLFEPDQRTVKADIEPVMNRLVAFFSDSSAPHEVRCARRERSAVTIWYLDQEVHLAYHSAEDDGQ